MEQIVAENLFLLEFLVDKCIILPCAIPKEIQQVTGESCVSFKFLDNEPLDICEADFTPKRHYTDEENMKSGKSCLFAMSSSQAEEALTEFDVVVGVFKKLTNGMLPDKIQIGTAVIPVASTFNEVIQLLQAAPEQTETVSRTLKDCFNITNINFEVIGSISIFLRMSCFGKLIVTQFQMNLDDKSVFFKDKEGKSLYKYRKASKAEDKGTGAKKCRPLRPISPPEDEGVTFDEPCQDCLQDSYQPIETPAPVCAFATTEGPLMPYNNNNNINNVPLPSNNNKGNFQEIGAEMNGNSLTIRVHKSKGIVKRVDGEECDSMLGDQEKYGKNYQNNPCHCLGQNGAARHQQQQQQQQQNGCYCLNPPMPQQNGSFPCADKQMLSLKPADDPNNPFAFRVSGCPGGGGNQNVTVVSPTNTRPDGMQVTEVSDPTKDVFILRIGKKSEGTDKKANLELELVTPKGVDRKPAPKKETRETQYSEKDAGPGKEGKSKSKSKGGGKGKKGGKANNTACDECCKNPDKFKREGGGRFGGGVLMKADRFQGGGDPCYCVCYPPGWNQCPQCCEPSQNPCWNVPSRTNINCSMGRITSAKACCYCMQ